jgi:drug/metabolite transporter (DMT)-like permease
VRAAAPRRGGGWRVHAALASAQLGFALFPVLGKLALSSIPPMAFAALRVSSAAVLLEILRRVGPAERIAPGDRRALFLFALLGVSINQVLFILGLSLSTAIQTTILTAMIPVFTLAAAVALGREKLTGRAIASLLLAGAGAFLLLRPRAGVPGESHLAGNVLLLANGLSYSLYLVFSRPLLARYRVLTFTAAIFRYGALPIVLVALPSLLRFDASAVPARAWLYLAGVIVVSTVIPYLCNSWALARVDASRVAFYVLVQPLMATVLAILVLGERLSAATWVAGVLILAGLAVSSWKRRLPARPVP